MSYSQKEIKFENTQQYKIKGSDLFDGMVADLSKLFTNSLLNYCEKDFNLEIFALVQKEN